MLHHFVVQSLVAVLGGESQLPNDGSGCCGEVECQLPQVWVELLEAQSDAAAAHAEMAMVAADA
jgi:hypothetical protein